MNQPFIVRFAPSPTGFLHLGSARTALFNWLAARSSGGRFLLRVEDTDKVRSEQRFLDEILEDLRWLGLDWDGEPLYQSRRFDLYREKAESLVSSGQAYREGEAILFRVVPGRKIAYDDLIHGRIEVETENIKDQVLIKSDGSPAYNFCCVVDDTELGITHILRGDDHISNTPKQILFYEAFGVTPPRFGHMPLILGPDGSKLSKRHGGVSVAEYKAEGFLPEALANYLIFLGWTPPDGREILELGEAARLFSIDRMNDVQAKFDLVKLKWMNGEYIMSKETPTLVPLLRDQLRRDGFDFETEEEGRWAAIADLYKIRIKTLREFGSMVDFFFRDDFPVDEDGRKKHPEPPERKALLADLAARIEALPEFSAETLEAMYRAMADEKNIKASELIHPTRMAVSGRTKGAGLFEIMAVLGRETVLRRLKRNAS
ncbi:MAG: glutamate--tRNA ligase [Candidatus Aminicenantes bacterium]|nr:glutamate--tRNA ligase [Candidatus Aminicenantes bacterium]